MWPTALCAVGNMSQILKDSKFTAKLFLEIVDISKHMTVGVGAYENLIAQSDKITKTNLLKAPPFDGKSYL